MDNLWIALSVGIVIGACLGVLLMAVLITGRNSDEDERLALANRIIFMAGEMISNYSRNLPRPTTSEDTFMALIRAEHLIGRIARQLRQWEPEAHTQYPHQVPAATTTTTEPK